MARNHSKTKRTRRWWLRPGTVGLIAGVLAAVVWLGSGFYTIDSNERGVLTRFGSFRAKVQPGIHWAWPWPIDRVRVPPGTTQVRSIEVGFKTLGWLSSEPRRSDMLTGDENILKIMMVVQYRVHLDKTRGSAAYLFETEEPHWLVERAVEYALISEVAARAVDDVLTTAKQEVQHNVIKTAQQRLDEYEAGIVLVGGNLQTVSPPAMGGVSEAFKDVASAKKDAERKIDEAREYESQTIPQANGQAQEMVSRAQAYYADRVARAQGDAHRFLSVLAEYRRAREITRTRVFLEAMERILSQVKVIVVERTDAATASGITIVEQ
ncbi:MAG: FtsH protease activity modulator HflK [Planctomycetes bacterium]|nr:FtsH protease activity modulator HflK [Planctomycetota bacterium]